MKSRTDSVNTELEAKYVLKSSNFDAIKQVLTALKNKHKILIAGVREEHIIDQYFDTRDFALANHQASLRLRKTDIPGYILSFKRNYEPPDKQNQIFRRVEIEGVPDITLLKRIAEHAPWLAFHLAQEVMETGMPGELEMFHAMGLYDTCRVENKREIYTVLYDKDLKVEMCFDSVEASTLGKTSRFHELECELLSGDKASFKAFYKLLEKEMPWLKPSRYNKYLRSLQLLKIWKPSKTSKDKEYKRWRKQFSSIYKRFGKNYKKAISFNDPEDVHKTRVSIRQIVTLLDFLLQRNPNNSKSATEIYTRLKKVQKLLGKVRDYDVLIEVFEKDDPEAETSNEIRHELAHVLSLERDRTRLQGLKRLPEFVNKDLNKYWSRFTNNELPKMLANIDLQADYMDLKRRLATTSSYFLKSREIRGPLHPITVKNMHRTRILSKKLRYSAEYLSFTLPGDQTPDIERYKALQTRLGSINDLYNHLDLYGRMKDNLGAIIGDQVDAEMAHIERVISSRISAISSDDFNQGISVVEDESIPEIVETDLDLIKGIGPITTSELRERGIRSLHDIASLTMQQLDHLAENGYDIRERVQREEWVQQAHRLLSVQSESAG